MKKGCRRFSLAVSAAGLLVASGCTGTDVLSTGNEGIVIEAVADQQLLSADCVQVIFARLVVRPLDGTCAPTSPLPGARCFAPDDCNSFTPGDCVGSLSSNLILGDGITVLPTPDPIDPTVGVKKGTITSTCNPAVVSTGKFPQPFVFPTGPLPSGLYRIHDLDLKVAAYDNEDLGSINDQQCQVDEAGYTSQDREFTVVAGATKSIRFVVNVAALVAATPSNCPLSNQSSIVQIVK